MRSQAQELLMWRERGNSGATGDIRVYLTNLRRMRHFNRSPDCLRRWSAGGAIGV